MAEDNKVISIRGHQSEAEPADGLYPLPWVADEAGRIHDARGRQVGAMVRPHLAQLLVRVLNAAVALNQAQADAERPS